jgi:apolipoprotein N-acyltransferase
VRAANNGISAVIDSHGRILASLPLGTVGVLDAALPGKLSGTVYAQLGDWPLAILIVLATLIVLRMRLKT